MSVFENTFNVSTGQFIALAPEFFLAAALCGLWLMASGRFSSRFHDYNALTVALTAVAVVFSAVWLDSSGSEVTLFGDLVVVNFYTQAVKLLCLLGILPFVLGYVQHRDQTPVQTQLLMVTALFFMLILVSSNSLLTAYLNIEGLSIMLYVLAGAARTHGSSEAGLKYYGAGAAISAILLFGIALVYHGAHSFELAEITTTLWNSSDSVALVVGLRLVRLALLMKLAAVPGHVWAPDVYEGVPTSVTAFFATVSKMMVFAFTARFVYGCLGAAVGDFIIQNTVGITLLAAVSIAIGCFGALGQVTFKRFVAYASINQIGFLMIGLAVGTETGIQRTLHYLVVYMAAGVALFIALLGIESYGLQIRYLSDLAGAFHRGANGPVILAFIAVLSMAGLPPFAGFFGKYALWAVLISGIQSAASSKESIVFSVLMATSVVTSLFSMYYYLRVLKVTVFERTDDLIALPKTGGLSLSASGIAVGVVLTLWVFILPQLTDLSILDLIQAGVAVISLLVICSGSLVVESRITNPVVLVRF
jgi:NADH-quinone oxidoreductase subunit N